VNIYDNPLRDQFLIGRQPAPSPRPFHRRLPGYAVTPLHSVGDLSESLGVATVWVKDEASRLGLPAFKMLGASWAIYRLLERVRGARFDEWESLDELVPQLARLGPLVLAAATDGNHGRAVARMARLLGLAARVRVPAGTVAARIDAIASEGAEVSVSPGNYDAAVAEVASWTSDTTLVVSDTSWEGYEEIPKWIIDGYSTIFAEVDEQLSLRGADAPTAVFVPVGVGAFAAAVVDWLRRPSVRPARLFAVEPVDAACVLASAKAGGIVTLPGEQRSIMAGLNCGTPSQVAWPRVSAGTDCFVTVSDDAARSAMRAFAAAGIVAGESGAASLAGAVAAAEAGLLTPDDRVLLLSTEGATDPTAYEQVMGRAAPVVAPA
jgi:diaminopropionate ammonia-lyase